MSSNFSIGISPSTAGILTMAGVVIVIALAFGIASVASGTDEIRDAEMYVEDYADEHEIETTAGPPATLEQAATDGGSD